MSHVFRDRCRRLVSINAVNAVVMPLAVNFKFDRLPDFVPDQRLADRREITEDAVLHVGIPGAKDRERFRLV